VAGGTPLGPGRHGLGPPRPDVALALGETYAELSGFELHGPAAATARQARLGAARGRHASRRGLGHFAGATAPARTGTIPGAGGAGVRVVTTRFASSWRRAARIAGALKLRMAELDERLGGSGGVESTVVFPAEARSVAGSRQPEPPFRSRLRPDWTTPLNTRTRLPACVPPSNGGPLSSSGRRSPTPPRSTPRFRCGSRPSSESVQISGQSDHPFRLNPTT
jgi:hypothetical protein